MTARTSKFVQAITGFTLAWALLFAGHAQADGRHQLKIESKSVSEALKDFATQTGLQVLVMSADVGDKHSVAIEGLLTSREALALLLRDSGLTYKMIDERTIAVRAKSDGAPRRGAAVESGSAAESLRLARVEADSSAATPEEESPAPKGGSREAAKSGEQASKGIPEMLVEGKRTSNTDIRRTEDDVQPYVVFEAEEIENAMAPDLETFLRTRLPMNQSYETESMRVTGRRGGQSSINLRGLGADETLVLVNGRRMPGVAKGGEPDIYQPDLNGIPLSSVERIEILPSTAGGIYGGGATGGVVNVILKRDYRGWEVRGVYDNTMHGGGMKRRLEANAGFSLEGGRTSITAAASYTDSNPLLQGDRDFNRQTRRRILANDPDSILSSPFTGYPIRGYTTNINSVSGNPLILAATNQSLGYATAHVPVGYAGPDSDGGAAFLATAGSYNLDMPNEAYSGGARHTLITNPTVRSVSLSTRRRFTDRIEAFVDVSNNDNRSASVFMGARSGQEQILPAGPNSPFTEDVRISMPVANFEGDSGRQTAYSETRSIAGGLIIRLPAGWTAQAEYAWGRANSGHTYNFDQLTNDGKAAIIDGRLDPLRDVNAFPLDFSPYYFTPRPQYAYDSENLLKDATLRLAGPIWKMPGGSMILSTLLENREELTEATVATRYTLPDVPQHRYYPSRGSTTDSAYVEVTAPLVSAVNSRPGIQDLELQASYRYDRSRTLARTWGDFGVIVPSPDGPFPQSESVRKSTEASQYTFGFRYQPTAQWALRASYGEGVLPPSVVQLAPSISSPASAAFWGSILSDPKRGGESLSSLMIYSSLGSVDLRPEQSASWSAGLIITPDVLPGLRLSVDYTLIKKVDEIGTVNRQLMLSLEDQGFASRIVRGPLTPADQALGYTGGPILEYDSGLVNIAHTEMEAYDVQTEYAWHTAYGEFSAHFMATYQTHLLQQALPGTPTLELVGFQTGPLKFRGNGGLTWRRGAWSAGWNMQYYDSYSIFEHGFSDEENAERALTQGSPTIPSQTYHDVFARYRFGDSNRSGWGLLNNTEILVSVQNVLDTSPPILTSSSSGATAFSPYGDPRLRSYSISVKKSFQ